MKSAAPAGRSGRVLVIRGGAIGDFILTLPVLAALRTHLPGIRLELLGYPHIAQLAVAGGLVDAVRPIEARPLAAFFAAGSALPADWAEYFGSFDLVLSYLYDPDKIFAGNLRRCSRAQLLIGPHRPPEGGNHHATAAFLKPLERLAVFDADPCPRLRLQDEPPADVAGWRFTLAAHPGSGSAAKNWPAARWAELLGDIATGTDWRVLLVGGEAEGDRLETLAGCLPTERRQLAAGRPLVELAWALTRCRAFLGHDSGITHLAAALGVPGVALWGPSNPAVWRPLASGIEVLRDPAGLEALAAPSVRLALARRLELLPRGENT